MARFTTNLRLAVIISFFAFSPSVDMFVSISEANLNSKIHAMECYEFEKRPYPHPRSPEALKIQAQRWGVTVGVDFAEAFMVIRTVCK